jgi:response regulator RpfG family c-di-GMP phosphodiesterase
MLRGSVKTITIKTLLTAILIASLVMTVIIGTSFRSLSHRIVKNQAIATSEIIKAGLTSHMKSGMMDKRDYYLEEIKSLHNINSVEMIRSPEINEQYGAGYKIEKSMTPLSEKVFRFKEPIFILNEFDKNASIRALIPFIASKEGSLNCLSCHKVSEGTVLGVVDIEIDVSEYRNISLGILFLIFAISLILVLLIIINTFRTIQIYIQEPLESLIIKAKEAYQKKKMVDETSYESLEFRTVAKEINLFNSDIIKTHDMLEKKNIELASLNDEIEDTLRETVFTMGVIEEERSKETKNHTKRVTEYCKLIASKLGHTEKEIRLIGDAAPLHDIGKIGISDYILLKSQKLTEEEFEIMKNHTKIGYAMLAHSSRDILKAAATIAHQHHERWDGTGYPNGLSGEEIHIFGRIVALADVFDALSTARPYKEAWPMEKVISKIGSEKNKHFDPALVEIFLQNTPDFIAIKEHYASDR